MKKIILILLVAITGQIQAQSTENKTYQGEAERINNLIHTKLDVQLNFEKEELEGKEWVTLSPHFYPTDSLTLNAQYMVIHKVDLVENNKSTPLQYTYDNQLLKIKLNRTYTRDQSYEIYIQYTARPSQIPNEGNAAITDSRGLYFINADGKDPNKPIQAWTQGETTESSAWFPTIDEPNQKTSQEINITVPSNFVTLSNGTLTAKIDNGNGTRTDSWRQTQKHAPYLFFMGIGDFAVVEDEWRGRPVNYYVEKEYEPYAKEIFGMTPEMITFYSNLFGYEYPWDKYSQMVVRDFVSGAMENTTAVSHMQVAQQKHGELVDENRWENVIAHELVHHWFGDLVTTESWANLTVNESFANYGEYLWLEHKYGKDYADAHRKEDLDGYFFGNNFDKDLVRFDYHKAGDMFDAVSYNKGGYILHMLRNFLGDEAFFAGLKYYLNHHEYGKAEAQELRLAFEHVSGKDLNWFFNQWYYGNGHPKLKVITEDKEGEVIVHLSQTQGTPLFEFPVTIDVYENGVAKRHKVWAKKQKINTFTFPVSKKADLVIVDAENDLVAEIEETKTPKQYAQQYEWAKDEYASRIKALDELAYAQLIDKDALKTLISALDDPYFGIRIKAINALQLDDAVVKNAVEKKLVELAEKDPKTLVQAAALKQLAKIDNEGKYIALFKKALHSESFSVQGAAIDYLIKKDPKSIENNAQDLDIQIIMKSPKLLELMIPKWRQENNLTYFPQLTELAAVYAFVPFSQPEMANAASMAFDWIMSTNDLVSTEKAVKIYQSYYKQLKDTQKEAIPFLQNMVNKALKLKKETYEQYPNASLEKQIQLLEETADELNK